MQEYSDQSTLIRALENHDFRVIKRCMQAGQSLNDVYEDQEQEESLFLDSCARSDSMFNSFLVMKKHVDFYSKDNEGANCLAYCDNVYKLDTCLKILPPIDVNDIFTEKDTGKVFNALTFNSQFGGRTYQMCLMLLSVGCDPRNATFNAKIKSQVQKWIFAIECAKKYLKNIFDNEMLEAEVIAFVFNEDFLRKALRF